MSKRLLTLISLLVLLSIILANCGQGPSNTQATATAPATQTVIVAPTFTPTVTSTSTVEPNPGVDELKKIDPLILDGGPIEFFGIWFDEYSHELQGATLYTDSYNELVFIKKDGLITVLNAEDHLAYTMPAGARYIRYRYNQAEKNVDVVLAMKQLLYAINVDANAMLQIAPKGVAFRYAIQGMNGSPEIGDDIMVTIDHDHGAKRPLKTAYAATQYNNLPDGTTITLTGAMIAGFVCEGDTVYTVVVAFYTYTAQCNETQRTAIFPYFIEDDLVTPRDGTPEEVYQLRKHLFSTMDELAKDYSQVEYFTDGFEIGDVYPLDTFHDTHQVKPTATSTLPPTATRTPRTVPNSTPTATAKP